MKRLALLCLAAPLATGLAAQSNVVAGLNGRLTIVDDLTYWGRRGAAHPGGEVGMSMLNEMCNPGSVVIPWQVAMSSNHPKFGFLIVRVNGGKIEQINDWSYCKHAFTSVNYSGPCGSCQDPGTGQLMGINCADAYSSGNNGDRYWLGPPVEINPWLGTWAVVGSYFDRGDPAVVGPQATDGIRSLTQNQVNAFDQVKNRVTVKESDLLTPSSSYFYGIQLIHQGEAVANRTDNLASRGFTPNWSGSSWSVSNNAVAQAYGSILNRWPGAEVHAGQNGNDDGRFFVAVVVTPLGGGNYHYEYAVHNVDNDRGGATFKLPVDAGATVSNYSFGDIDTNPLNDWTGARVGNEIVFTAPASNPLNWNTIYNFGFDCNFAPGSSLATLDEARVGPGNLFVTVTTKAPSGSTVAQATPTGTGCGSAAGCPNSFYEQSFDLPNSGWTIAANAGTYTLGSLTGAWITPAGSTLALGDDAGSLQPIPFSLSHRGGTTNSLWVCSNGFVSVNNNGTEYNPSSGGFLSGQATWAGLWHDLNPSVGGSVRFDATAQRVVVSYVGVPNFGLGSTATFQLQFWANGTVHCVYQAVAVGGNGYLVGYTVGNNAPDPGPIDISATLPTGLPLCSPVVPPIPALALAASARPIIGTSINLNTTNIRAGTVLGLSILSTTQHNPGIPLAGVGMPGCTLYLNLDVLNTFATPGSSASVPLVVPNVPSLSGAVIINQSATLTPGINAFGFAVSNALVLLLGVL